MPSSLSPALRTAVMLLQSRPETVWAAKDAEAKPVVAPSGNALTHVMGIFSGGVRK